MSVLTNNNYKTTFSFGIPVSPAVVEERVINVSGALTTSDTDKAIGITARNHLINELGEVIPYGDCGHVKCVPAGVSVQTFLSFNNAGLVKTAEDGDVVIAIALGSEDADDRVFVLSTPPHVFHAVPVVP